MDRESAKINIETTAVRGRGWVRSLVRLLGIIAVLVGAYNFMVAPMMGDLIFPFYRGFVDQVFVGQAGIVSLADILLMAVGAAVAWFV